MDKISLIVVLVLAIGMIGSIATIYAQVSNLDTDSVTWNQSTAPFNITLNYEPAQVLNVTNGSMTMPADNYTIFESDSIIQINEQTTYTGGNLTVTYGYEPENYISGSAKVMLGIVLLVVIVMVSLFGLQKYQR